MPATATRVIYVNQVRTLDAKVFACAVSVFVLVFIIYGIVVTGTPGQQRALQFDQRRVSDIQQISYAIDSYWQNNEKLPASFADLKNQQYSYIQSVMDPKTQVAYEYRVLGDKSYELCATFETDSSKTAARFKTQVPFSEQSWDHTAGRVCFEREVQALRKNAIPSF